MVKMPSREEYSSRSSNSQPCQYKRARLNSARNVVTQFAGIIIILHPVHWSRCHRIRLHLALANQNSIREVAAARNGIVGPPPDRDLAGYRLPIETRITAR